MLCLVLGPTEKHERLADPDDLGALFRPVYTIGVLFCHKGLLLSQTNHVSHAVIGIFLR